MRKILYQYTCDGCGLVTDTLETSILPSNWVLQITMVDNYHYHSKECLDKNTFSQPRPKLWSTK